MPPKKKSPYRLGDTDVTYLLNQSELSRASAQAVALHLKKFLLKGDPRRIEADKLAKATGDLQAAIKAILQKPS